MLDQLEHLDQLDDALPPAPDAAMLARVRDRAGRRQRRNRLAAAASIVLVIAIVAGVAAIARGHKSSIVLITSPSSTTAPTPRHGFSGSQSSLPNGMRVTVTLLTDTVQLGGNVRARVEVFNLQGRVTTIGPGRTIQCALGVGPELKDAKGNVLVDALGRGGDCLPVVPFAAGKTATFTTELSTAWLRLPPGASRAEYSFTLGSTHPDPPRPRLVQWSTPRLPVEIVAPKVTARVEILDPTVVRGHAVSGFVVFDNKGASPVSAGCSTHRDYRVSLFAGDVEIRNPALRDLNPTAACQRPQLQLPPGITRLPFKLTVQYFGCSPDASAQLGIPRCVTGPGIRFQAPPLPPGSYEVVMTSVGAIGALDGTQAPIQVVAR